MAAMKQATRAPGKAMLIGEYAVLDGAPAVVAAVDCYAVARLCPGEPASSFITCAVSEAAAALAELGVLARPPAGLVPVVDTQSFSVGGRKLGVGSSASATVAAVGALLAAAGVAVDQRPSQRVVQRAATRAHDAAQGVRGSGADVLAATFGGLCVLNAPEPVWDPLATPAAPPLPAELCFVATTTSVSTAALVGRYREVGAAAQPAIQLLRTAAERFLRAWQDQDGGALLEAVAQAAAGYAALGTALDRQLVTADHARIAVAAHKVGGVAKPSGAGGGDLAVVFLPPGTPTAALALALPPELPLLNLHVSPRGLHLVEI